MFVYYKTFAYNHKTRKKMQRNEMKAMMICGNKTVLNRIARGHAYFQPARTVH